MFEKAKRMKKHADTADKVMTKLDKVKKHVEEHKVTYISCAAVAGITYLIMRDQSMSDLLRGQSLDPTSLEDKSKSITVSQNFGVIHQGDNITNVNVKRLSYIVRDDTSNRWWSSQSEAARDLGISECRVSQHLNHGAPLENGVSLSRMGVSSA